MKSSFALLIIDPQYDFCHKDGALFVPGADEDMQRLADWIKKNKERIDHITVTGDSHPVNSISHPSFWTDKNGNFPAPFTAISSDMIKQGFWKPRFFPDQAVQYVEALEQQGEFQHFIWPFHCLTGSMGASIYGPLMDALVEWSMAGKSYQVVTKGTYALSEHFGIFRANIPVKSVPETQLNTNLISSLNQNQKILLAGEARSHCVANSLKQAMHEAPELAQKFIILEDCMSDVTGLEHLGEPAYREAREMGIEFARSKDV